MSEQSAKPYLIRAICEWCADNGLTPYLAVKVNAQFFINRFDFNIKYPGKANDLIRKEVVLKIDVNAAPGKADFSAIEKGTPTAATGSAAALASTR